MTNENQVDANIDSVKDETVVTLQEPVGTEEEKESERTSEEVKTIVLEQSSGKDESEELLDQPVIENEQEVLDKDQKDSEDKQKKLNDFLDETEQDK